MFKLYKHADFSSLFIAFLDRILLCYKEILKLSNYIMPFIVYISLVYTIYMTDFSCLFIAFFRKI